MFLLLFDVMLMIVFLMFAHQSLFASVTVLLCSYRHNIALTYLVHISVLLFTHAYIVFNYFAVHVY